MRPVVKPAIKSFIESPNYSPRGGASIDMIVLHCTRAATSGGTITWFLNRKSRVSAHYVIDKNGDIYQMVSEEYSAWHAKSANPRSIGIEHVGTATDRLTDAQSMASAQLVRWLTRAYGIPLANVVGHRFAPGNEGTTDCPFQLFGEATGDAVAEWVNTNVADTLESNEIPRGRQLAAEPVGCRAPQLPGWTRPLKWLARLRSDMSQIHQNVRRLSHSPAVPLTALELMTIALEDRRFFYHPGVDVPSIVRESIKALAGRKHGGASTIDMQFVRTVTGFRGRTIKRKIYEAFLALVIQFRYKKLEILRSYLACAFFGSGLIGANAAAQDIFNKNADLLSIEEASFISAMLAYPRLLTHELPGWEQRVRRRAVYAIAVALRQGRLRREAKKIVNPVVKPVTICVLSKYASVFGNFVASINKYAPNFPRVLVGDGPEPEEVIAAELSKWKVIRANTEFEMARFGNLSWHAAADDSDLLYTGDDTMFLEPNTVERLQQIAYKDSSIGILSPRLLGRSSIALAKPKKEIEYVRPLEMWFPFVYIKRELINKIGYLDERFSQFGSDDLDYCLRAQMAGYRLACTRIVTVFHGASDGGGPTTFDRSIGMDERRRQKQASLKKLREKYGINQQTLEHVLRSGDVSPLTRSLLSG